MRPPAIERFAAPTSFPIEKADAGRKKAAAGVLCFTLVEAGIVRSASCDRFGSHTLLLCHHYPYHDALLYLTISRIIEPSLRRLKDIYEFVRSARDDYYSKTAYGNGGPLKHREIATFQNPRLAYGNELQ